jgi:hypothetical protein
MAKRRYKYEVGDMVTYITSKNETINIKIKLKMYIEEHDLYSYFLDGHGWIPENKLTKYEFCDTEQRSVDNVSQ